MQLLCTTRTSFWFKPELMQKLRFCNCSGHQNYVLAKTQLCKNPVMQKPSSALPKQLPKRNFGLSFGTTEFRYKAQLYQNFVLVRRHGIHLLLLPLFKAISHKNNISPGSGKKSGQRYLFIRKLSDKSQCLHLSPKVVKLNSIQFFRKNNRRFDTLLYPSEGVGSIGTESAEWLQRKSSIFSFDLKYNQLLFARTRFYRSSSNRKLGYLYATNLEKMSFLSSDLSNLGLSLKTYTLLKQNGVHKIGNLVACSPKALLHLLNKNREMFAEVKRCFVLVAICGNP